MRVLYLEEELGGCDSDDVADGVISSYEDVLYIDDIATPGQFWLNPPSSRNEFGDRVDPYLYTEQLKRKLDVEIALTLDEDFSQSGSIDDDEMERILADLDSL